MALEFWRKENSCRMVIAHQLQDLQGYRTERDLLEESWMEMVDSLDDAADRNSEMKRIMDCHQEQEDELINRTLKDNESTHHSGRAILPQVLLAAPDLPAVMGHRDRFTVPLFMHKLRTVFTWRSQVTWPCHHSEKQRVLCFSKRYKLTML